MSLYETDTLCASLSIDKILTIVVDAIGEGLKERKNEKEAQEQEKQAKEKAETDDSIEAEKIDESIDDNASENNQIANTSLLSNRIR